MRGAAKRGGVVLNNFLVIVLEQLVSCVHDLIASLEVCPKRLF